MKRSGFKRAAYEPPPPSPIAPAYRRATYTTGGRDIAPRPKEPRLECPHLLLMARSVLRPCLIGSPQCPTHGFLTIAVQCCACHGNSSIYGKGRSIKAHDFYSVWGCARCHTWMDSSYSASGEERQQAFAMALPKQIIEWDQIAFDPTSSAKDVLATNWALAHLQLRGHALPRPVDTTYARIQETA